ncbi:GAF and ANTAR domain-containing protein [Streptomyces sp. MBT62]|uniref:GAF and ANTAR domain-containing protein n=1 Tax=Streptomyces sp. MBT62 TaxID=2800410 RepID=UPI00190CB6D9|nr:GAF and ANTAR domain-containing protein [Streptomyces sp. MBT62]MBK3564849.1 GAF and ANTAR domain-containing protein [Streptomyces sp. MBT62]
MVGGDPQSGGGAEEASGIERARIAHELVAGMGRVPSAEVPDVLCRTCVSLLPAMSGLSVSVTPGDLDSGVVLCASDGVAARLAEIQYTLGEGPGREAVRLRAPVLAPDLTSARDIRRWPLFSLQAAKAGAGAVFSLPLAGAGSALGTLDLYRRTPGSLRGAQVRTALLVADAISLVVVALDHASPEGVATWLAGAEADHEEVHQATGMIMVQLGVRAEEALLRLRARAFAEGRTSMEMARAVVDRTLDLRDE